MKILFLGNSATHVHDIPQMLQRLSAKVGQDFEIGQITPGGYKLSQHADLSTEHGQRVLHEIQSGYDIVFLQDNGNCIISDSMKTDCENACRTLAKHIEENGAKLFFYVRPPYGYEFHGNSPLDQCLGFDALFGKLSDELGAVCVYANRAFAYAIKNLNLDLWGPDNGHTSTEGAYLIACVFFATLFGRSATILDTDGLSTEVAATLQNVADKIVFEGIKY